MTKIIRVLVFSFVVFAVYFSFEQLAFKNTIFADSKSHCCESKACQDIIGVHCSDDADWFNPNNCYYHAFGTCSDCINLYSTGKLTCKPYTIEPYYCIMDNGEKYYGPPPLTPTGLTTSWVNGNEETGNPRIDWEPTPDADLDHYELWKMVDNYFGPDVNWFIKTPVPKSMTFYIDLSETGWGTMGPPRLVYYKLKAVDVSNLKSGFSDDVSFVCNDDNFYKRNISVEKQTNTHTINHLGNNYPNPFNPTTTISYSIAKQTFVEVNVYDILGKEVAKLVNEEQSKGKYKVNFNATNFPSGTYYYKITTNNFTDTKMMKFIK